MSEEERDVIRSSHENDMGPRIKADEWFEKGERNYGELRWPSVDVRGFGVHARDQGWVNEYLAAKKK